jgi:hypothetical protein
MDIPTVVDPGVFPILVLAYWVAMLWLGRELKHGEVHWMSSQNDIKMGPRLGTPGQLKRCDQSCFDTHRRPIRSALCDDDEKSIGLCAILLQDRALSQSCKHSKAVAQQEEFCSNKYNTNKRYAAGVPEISVCHRVISRPIQ